VSATAPVATVATGQGVPLSAAMGGGVRLFFEATGGDGKTRIYWVDSKDGYLGQDFNGGSATTCSTTSDYSSGGGCALTLAVGVESDGTSGNAKITNARQNKVAWPTQTDWRWDGASGTFMVFTTDATSGCERVSEAVQERAGLPADASRRKPLQDVLRRSVADDRSRERLQHALPRTEARNLCRRHEQRGVDGRVRRLGTDDRGTQRGVPVAERRHAQ
jgi:hypothetical protein